MPAGVKRLKSFWYNIFKMKNDEKLESLDFLMILWETKIDSLKFGRY